MRENLDYLFAFDTLLKAWNKEKIGTDLLLKAKQVAVSKLNSYPLNSPISFGDAEYNALSVNDLMEALADNSSNMNYCDSIVHNTQGKLLIIQRTNFDSFQPGKWCLPGGKADQSEFLRDAAKRELLEETGLKADSCNYSTLYRNSDGSFSHYFYCYVEDCDNCILDADEIQQYAWITLDELENFDFMLDIKNRIKEIFNVPFKGKYLTEQELIALSTNKIEKANTSSSLEKSYSKGCLMLDTNWISREGHDKWDEVLMKINPMDVRNEPGFGKEYEPHITVLYGFKLPTVTPQHIEKLLPDGPVSFTIVDVSYFEGDEYDVLKFGIDSSQLHELNALYRSLPHENEWPDYKPHLTIAYLKKGRAERYIPLLKKWVNRPFQSSKFDYTYNDENGLKAKAHWDVKGYESIEDAQEDKIIKGKAANIGEVRIWDGKKMQKQANGDWKEISENKSYNGYDFKISKEISLGGDISIKVSGDILFFENKYNGEDLGTFSFYNEPDEDHLKINKIEIRKEERGKGLAEKFLQGAVLFAKSKGLKGIVSRDFPRNSNALSMWNKVKNKKVGEDGNTFYLTETPDYSKSDKIQKSQQYQVGQISQKTGLKKVAPGKWVDPKTGKEVKADENGQSQRGNSKPADISKFKDEELSEYAKNSSEADLQAVIKESNEPRLREVAHKELERRQKEEAPKKDEETLKKSSEQKEEFSGIDFSEKDEFFKQLYFDSYDTQISSISKQEADTLNEYRDNLYFKLNKSLRQQEQFDENAVSKLDSAIGKSKLNHDVKLMRGLNKKAYEFFNSLKEGDSFFDKAYVSTTIDQKALDKFVDGEGFKMNILAKKGKTALPMQNIGDKTNKDLYKDEFEFLLPRDSKFKVVSKNENEITVELL